MTADQTTPVVPANARCLTCGYLLHSLPTTRCPECGRLFDPGNPLTYRVPHTPWWHWFTAPPGRFHVAVAALLSAVVLYAASLPFTFGNAFFCLCWPVLFVLCSVYVLRLTASIIATKTIPTFSPPRRAMVRWLAMPFVLLVILGCAVWPWPLRLRFEISRHSLEEAAKSPIENRSSSEKQWIGLYRVNSIERDYDGTVRFITGSSIIDPVGFEYRPNDDGPREDRLAARWYQAEW